MQAESSLGCSLQACTQVSRVIHFSFQNSFQLHTLAKSQQGSSVGAEFVGDGVMRHEGLTVLEERMSPSGGTWKGHTWTQPPDAPLPLRPLPSPDTPSPCWSAALWLGALPGGNPFHSARAPVPPAPAPPAPASAASSLHLGCSEPPPHHCRCLPRRTLHHGCRNGCGGQRISQELTCKPILVLYIVNVHRYAQCK